MAIILASQSPRRQELLQRITPTFKTVPANVDEDATPFSSPVEYVLAMALKKAAVVAKEYPKDTIIGCDTIVTIDHQILGKPTTKAEAYQMLSQLSGKKHVVYTSVVILKEGQEFSTTIPSTVEFYPLTDIQIKEYLETNEYKDKAGAYGIQGKAALFIKRIDGDYYAIMGLPIASLYRMLAECND